MSSGSPNNNGDRAASRHELEEVKATTRKLRREVGVLKDRLDQGGNEHSEYENLLGTLVKVASPVGSLIGRLLWVDKHRICVEVPPEGEVQQEAVYRPGARVMLPKGSTVIGPWEERDY